VVAIDGAPEHMGLVHMLGEIDPQDVEIGMRVEAVWRPEEDREGTVTDLLYFRPIPGPKKRLFRRSKQVSDLETPEPVEVKPAELTSVSAGSFPGKIPLDYAYTAGLGGRRFYTDLAAGKLSGTVCDECTEVLVPPSAFCERCLSTLDPEAAAAELDPASGVVAAATLVFEDRKGHPLDDPVWVVQVEFPDATGSILGKMSYEGVRVSAGMPVVLAATDAVGPEHVEFVPLGE
jgi:uncharacterized OB-fold protein